MACLDIEQDENGFISSDVLAPLTPGAEAHPFLDSTQRVVYKLFDLRVTGSRLEGKFGKKIDFDFKGEEFDVPIVDASWSDTVEKITILNDGGGLPTELVGFATTGHFLIAKQPQAYPFDDFFEDLAEAENAMCGIHPRGGELRRETIVSWVDGRAWAVTDLHNRNIMRTRAGLPVVIDALIGRITSDAQRRLPWLKSACLDARVFRSTGKPPADQFGNVDDADL